MEEKGGKVTFGDNDSRRIVGKDTISLNNGNTNIYNSIYVEGSKKKKLSVGKLCDQGYKFKFHSKGCDIMKAYLGSFVENVNKTLSDVHILDEFKEEKCWMEQNLGVISLSSHQ